MKEKIQNEVISSIFKNVEECKIEALTSGLINHSFKVSCNGKVVLLQKINQRVFSSPRDVQHNYLTLWHYAESEMTGLRIPAPFHFPGSKTLYTARNGSCWRAFEYIKNAYSYSMAARESQAKNTAKAFARFTAAFENFDPQQLKIVIPGFHDLSLRYRQFEEALKTEYYERMNKALPLIEELKKRERYKHFFEIIIESNEFLQRVMHHDAKISNVLFDNNNKVICPVDFDTVMPGYFFSDIGDMIRTISCSVDENSTDFKKITVRRKFYEALMDGYLKLMKDSLTILEKRYIHFAGLMMTYMQSLRFLTDYLNGDVYYKVSYDEQNVDRAKNQLTLLIELEKFLKKNYPD